MKRTALVLCLLAAAPALGACAPRAGSPTAGAAAAQASGVRPTPAADPAPPPSPPDAAAAAYVSGVEIVEEKIREDNRRLLYELDVSYPQIARPRSPQEQGFNRHVRNLIAGHIRSFKKFNADDLKRDRKKTRGGPYSLSAEYEVLYATPRFLSIRLTEVSFTGYVNEDWFTVPLNYDLRTGKPLELSELFRPDASYLPLIAASAVSELERRGVNCGGSGLIEEKKFREGTTPVAENYAGWNLTRRGILITFGEYQIGPGCLGLVAVVVPYEQLRDVLRDGAPLGHVG